MQIVKIIKIDVVRIFIGKFYHKKSVTENSNILFNIICTNVNNISQIINCNKM